MSDNFVIRVHQRDAREQVGHHYIAIRNTLKWQGALVP